MLKYLIILLDKSSIPFCHYDRKDSDCGLISVDNLKEAIKFGMKENLMIQFVYPDYDLPNEYLSIIDSIDHINIKPFNQAGKDSDILGFYFATESLGDSLIHLHTHIQLLIQIMFTDQEGQLYESTWEEPPT